MSKYYAERLSAERLLQCYELAPPRVAQYLAAEIRYVIRQIHPGHRVLELGCGYGRIIREIAAPHLTIHGIDISKKNLDYGRAVYLHDTPCFLARMDAVNTGYLPDSFDVVFCIQNGISAFQADPAELMRETLRITRSGGTVLFSSYAEKFWPHRLEWFQRQSSAGLIGRIDSSATGNGTIVCHDGFRATTVSREGFRELLARLQVDGVIEEVDDSAVFCKIVVK